MLKVNLDERNQDYFDYLVPFVKHVLAERKPQSVTEADVSQWILEDFGLQIPRRPAQLVLRRLAKRSLLTRVNGTFSLAEDFPPTNIEQRRAELHRHIEAVLHALKAYAQDHFTMTWSDKEANDVMLGFLSKFSIECLKTYIWSTTLPPTPTRKHGDQYVVSSFIKEAHQTNPPLFESIIAIVKGQMLANALTCPDLESLQKKFKNVTFYFDTPLILRLLRLQGDDEYEATRELVELLLHLDGKIAIFEHTTREVQNVLKFCLQNIEDPQAWNTRIIIEARRTGIKKSDLIELLDQLGKRYEKLGMVEEETPDYQDYEFQIDEDLLESDIDEEVEYRNPKAKLNDINSVRSIYALRRGQKPNRLEDARAVFVTSNSAFSKATYKFAKESEGFGDLSSVITDFSLANVAWLKAPLGAPDLPKRELISIAYAALQPPLELWSLYVRKTDELKARGDISPEDHELLRLSPVVRPELMNLTLGSTQNFSAAIIPEILSRAKQELVSEKQEELDLMTISNEQTSLELDSLAKKHSDMVKRWYWFSDTVGGVCARVVEVLLALAFLVSVFGPLLLIQRLNIPLKIILAFIVLGGILQFLSVWRGITIALIHQKLKTAIRERLYIKLLKNSG
jgi:hypothetical protein